MLCYLGCYFKLVPLNLLASCSLSEGGFEGEGEWRLWEVMDEDQGRFGGGSPLS